MSELQSISEDEVGSLDEELDSEGSEDGQEDQEVAIREVFDNCIDDESDEDDTKLAMIGAGATFKNVTRLYNKFMIDAGLALSKEDKASHVTTKLEGLKFEDEEGFDKAVVALVTDKINERSAGALLRAYAKKNDLDVYAKPKSEGTGKSGFASDFYDWLIANPTVSEEEGKAFIMNPDNSGNIHNHLSHYQNIRQLVNNVASGYLTDPAEPKAA